MPVCVYSTSDVHTVLILSVVTSFLITNLPSLCPYHDTIMDKCHQSCSQFCAAHGTSLVHMWISPSATFKCPKEWHISYLCKVWWETPTDSSLCHLLLRTSFMFSFRNLHCTVYCRSLLQEVCHLNAIHIQRNISIAFPADGAAQKFLGFSSEEWDESWLTHWSHCQARSGIPMTHCLSQFIQENDRLRLHIEPAKPCICWGHTTAVTSSVFSMCSVCVQYELSMNWTNTSNVTVRLIQTYSAILLN
jgi:hypothetical protein